MILKVFYIAVIALFLIELLVIFLRDRERIREEQGSIVYYSLCGFLVYVVTSLGVSDSALNTLAFRRKRYVPMEDLPGTLVTCAVVPFCTMSYAYLSYIDMSLGKILILAAASAAGSYFGASVVSRCPQRIIRLMVMTALTASACVLVAKLLFPVSGGDTGIQMTDAQTALTAVCVFFLMAFGMVGLSATAPIASIFMVMGMPAASAIAVAIVISSFGCCMGGIKYASTGRFQLKAVFCEIPFGVLGSLVGVRLIRFIPDLALQVFMLAVISFAVVFLVRDKEEDTAGSKEGKDAAAK